MPAVSCSSPRVGRWDASGPVTVGGRPHTRKMTELSPRDQSILEFEASWPRHTGIKTHLILTSLQLRVSRYYQLLNQIIDDPAALPFDPMLVKRLQRERDARISARAHREFRKHA
jgi:hypothetical protein